MDISSILGDSKIALERQATNQFGTAVESFTSQGSSALAGALGLTPAASSTAKLDTPKRSEWVASSYASALAGATDYRPKLKFLFKVEFIFSPEVVAAFPYLKSNDFTFMVKTVDRPKVNFEYEEDVNRYNFRTKVLKRITHQPLTIAFMDDTGNRVFDFFRTLMFLHQPITKRAINRDGSITAPTALLTDQESGMAFTSVDSLGSPALEDIAHRGVINSAVGGSIAVIRVKQMYINPNGRTAPNGARTLDPQEVTYDFINPRIVSFDLDDLTHESSDASILTMQFDYDWMEMVKVGTLTQADSPHYNITVPGITGAPVDVLNGANPSTTGVANSVGVSPAGAGNQFVNILVNTAQRAGQKITSDAIDRAVKNVAGSGPVGAGIAGALGGPLGSAVAGIVGAAQKSLFTNPSSAKSTYSSLTRPTASDSSTLSSDGATITTSKG